MVMNSQAISDSIENLYRVFAKYPLKPKIEGCPCCVKEEDIQVLYSETLRELSDLDYYGYKAMTTFGDVDDFKHFLPRLFELLIQRRFGYNDEILFDKLDHANWQNWEEKEKIAVENFLIDLIRWTVDFEKENASLTKTYLDGIAGIVKDITPYLNLWLEEISENRIMTLKYLIIDCDYGKLNSFHQNPKKSKQIKDWLISETTVQKLEDHFLNNQQLQNLPELSELLEEIYRLQRWS
jgi:hypothetical protein